MAQSVLARLKEEARTQGRPFDELLDLYAIERFLNRMGRSPHGDQLVLKGALLLRHWLGSEARPTRDVDLMGPANLDAQGIRALVEDILAVVVEDDGIEFDLASLAVDPIRPESQVFGYRARFKGYIGRTGLHYQVDIGLGDAVHPPPQRIELRALLDLPIVPIAAYTPYTTIAEKLEAMVVLGEANSRMKDYYDLSVIPESLELAGDTLAEAIRVCFERRSTPIPETDPEGLALAFAKDPVTAGRWRSFIRRRGLQDAGAELEEVFPRIRSFALPVLSAVRDGVSFPKYWPCGGPWGERKKT